MFSWFYNEEKEIEADERSKHLKHLLMKQIRNSEIRLRTTSEKKIILTNDWSTVTHKNKRKKKL